MRRIIKYAYIYVGMFLVVLINTTVSWALGMFNFLNFDEIIFQLSTPIESTEKSILYSFLYKAFKPSILIALIITFVLFLYFDYIKADRIKINIKLWNETSKSDISGKGLKISSIILILVISLFTVFNSLNKVKLFDYIEKSMTHSDFIGNNYVDAKKVKLKFPNKKKNLIYIFVESLESSFFDKQNGGLNRNDVLKPLLSLTEENLNFSHKDKIGGGYALSGATFTTAGMVAQTAGIPLKLDNFDINNEKFKTLVPGVYTLGEILDSKGYNQTIMFGSDEAFGNRGLYFKEHGNYYVYDLKEAKKLNKIPKNYRVWWGFEDSKLFDFAKKEALELSKKNKPFNLTLLTANTHFQDGYIEDSCSKPFADKYSNAIYCSAQQISDYIDWIKEQDFYKDTTIVIVGDHISMQKNYLPDDDRYVYNLFINSSASTENNKNRKFSTMDMFPTTLASLGVKIEGIKLGLGTNLFSNEKTLVEKYGYEYTNNELSYGSQFYLNKILLNK